MPCWTYATEFKPGGPSLSRVHSTWARRGTGTLHWTVGSSRTLIGVMPIISSTSRTESTLRTVFTLRLGNSAQAIVERSSGTRRLFIVSCFGWTKMTFRTNEVGRWMSSCSFWTVVALKTVLALSVYRQSSCVTICSFWTHCFYFAIRTIVSEST